MAAYGDELLFINDDSIVIDTGLSTREAAQAKLMQFLTEPGYIAKIDKGDAVSFTPYCFESSFEDIAKGRKNSSVFITGPAFRGVPLIELLNGDFSAKNGANTADSAERVSETKPDSADDSDAAVKPEHAARIEKARQIAEKICKITEASFEQGIKLPNNGPLGTIVGDDGTILFLPPSIFSRALDSRGDAVYSLYEGCWKNTALSEKDCLRFTASSYAYCVYSGKAPFTEKDSQKRAADFYDKNFLKLSWFCAFEKDGKQADFREIFSKIEQNLCCSAPEMEKKKKRGIFSKKKVMIPSVEITELPSFDKRIISDVATVPAYESQQKTLKRVRFIRKNGVFLNVGIVAFVILCLLIASHINNLKNKPTTLGLEPVEVVQMFYDGFDTLDTNIFDATRTDGAGDGLSNVLATVFVTAKMRESYEGKQTYTPSQWLNIRNPETLDIYGLTQLEIEEEQENAGDDIKFFTAHYYVVHTENSQIIVSEVVDELAVTFKKDRWLVSFYLSGDRECDVDSAAFYEDLRNAIPANSTYKPSDLLDALADKYEWLPTAEEAAKGYEQLFAESNW